jgi:hypothetical protein
VLNPLLFGIRPKQSPLERAREKSILPQLTPTIMAEVAAALWATEEVVSTGVQVGIAAYMVSQPTVPLKGTFRQIATAPDDHTK